MKETKKEYLKRIKNNIKQVNENIEQFIDIPEFKEIYFSVTEYFIEFFDYVEKNEYSAEDCDSILTAFVARVKAIIEKKYAKELNLASSDEFWKDAIDFSTVENDEITKEMLLNNLKHIEEQCHIAGLKGNIYLLEAKLVQILLMNNPRIAEMKGKNIFINFDQLHENNSHDEQVEIDSTLEEIERYGCTKEDAHLLEEFMQEEYPEFDELLGRVKDKDEEAKVIIQTVNKEMENPNRRGIFGFPKIWEPKNIIVQETKKIK